MAYGLVSVSQEYGTFRLTTQTAQTHYSEQLQHLLLSLSSSWSLLTPLPIAGVISIFISRSRKLREKISWSALTLSFLISGPFFLILANARPVLISSVTLERFYLLPALLLAPACSQGIEAAAAAIAPLRRSRHNKADPAQHQALVKTLSIALAPMVAQLNISNSVKETEKQRGGSIEEYLLNSLQGIPRKSVIITSGDDQLFGYPYLQESLKSRPDLKIISERAISDIRYPKRASTILNPSSASNHGNTTLELLVRTLTLQGTQVFVTPIEGNSPNIANLLQTTNNYPVGVFRKIENPNQQRPTAREIFQLNQTIYQQYNLIHPRPSLTDGWALAPAATYKRTWPKIAQLLHKEGELELAKEAEKTASRFKICPSYNCAN